MLVLTKDIERVRIITISRSEKRNAFNNPIVQELHDAITAFEQSEQRALIIQADGNHFCAGADLNDPPKEFWKCLPGPGISTNKPIICAAQGWTVGLGVTLAMYCDLVICSEDAQFMFPEGRVGIFGGFTAGLVARIPQKIAVEFLMLGEAMPASRAYEVGMVNRVVPGDQLETAALNMASTLSEMAPKVLSAIKRWTTATLPASPAEIFVPEARLAAEMMGSNDFREGMASFKERRKPVFTNS